MTVWLLALLVCAGLVFLHRRRRRLQHRIRRSHEHEVALEMLDDWLTSEDIQRALVTTGSATLLGLEAVHETMGDLDEDGVRALIANLTRDRNVRRVIAAHIERTVPGFSRGNAMKALAEMYDAGRDL